MNKHRLSSLSSLNNSSVSINHFVDYLSGNEFEIQQAKGLPVGERALIFIKSPKFGNKLPKGNVLCGYSENLDIMTEEEFNDQGHIHKSYAVGIKEGIVGLPKIIIPANNNLGVFANAALGNKIDPLRKYANANLKASFHSNFNQGIQLYLQTTKKLETGDEVLISYGSAYNKYLRELINSQN